MRATLPFVALLALTLTAPGVSMAQATAAVPGVEAQLEFLRTAKVVASRRIGKGVTGASRLTLTDGRLTHDAAFQTVAQERLGQNLQKARRPGADLLFVDHYRYNIAAWKLATLVGLAHMMPATVERSVRGRKGALSWWVDDVLMDEQEREQKNAQPPKGVVYLARQKQTMWVFAELVRDTDRNKGNVLYTTDWRVVMLDFTRAFRLQKDLPGRDGLNGCERGLLARLRTLTESELKESVEDHLTSAEIAAVLARRDLLVSHFDRLIKERGERAVLY
jgi:hypothetical protein